MAKNWKVDPLPELTEPDSGRTDLVYLDIWEREVNEQEDSNLTNPAIGVPTCVRFKREWVMRVLENCDQSEVPKKWKVGSDEQKIRKAGHAYYPLARKVGQQIDDLRRTGLTLSNFRNGWVRLPFLPKQLNRDPEFNLFTVHASCESSGAAGSMEIPIPLGVNRINRFQIAGNENEGDITVTLSRINLSTYTKTITKITENTLLNKTINATQGPFNVMWTSTDFTGTSLDPEGSALAVLVKATKKADIWFIAVEFMG